MKIVSVVGTRPELIQAAPVSRALREDHREVLVHTGQHYDLPLSSWFFDELDLPVPNYNLAIGSGSHNRQTAQIMVRLEEVLREERPDLVLVQGDTNSTLGGALAASKFGTAIAHIEAGERSFNRRMSEEINRLIATDSGGVQREAYFLGVPCLTLRDETEWIETVETGWNKVVGADADQVLMEWETFSPTEEHPAILGDGKASHRIARILGGETVADGFLREPMGLPTQASHGQAIL